MVSKQLAWVLNGLIVVVSFDNGGVHGLVWPGAGSLAGEQMIMEAL